MKFHIIVAFMLVSSALWSQDAKSDFEKINKTYHAAAALAFDIKYELFLDGTSTVYETETGKYIKHDGNYYTKQDKNEVVITDAYMFMVDDEAKVLALDKKPDQQKLISPLAVNLDSLYMLYSKIEVLQGPSANIKGYRFYIKEGPYSLCDVFFDVNTNMVTSIVNVFRHKITDENEVQHTAVLKTTFTTVPVIKEVFDHKKYIVVSGKKITPSVRYKTYQFINHLN